MSKKELRKELELILIKTIEEVLNKRNAEATKKIKKATQDASKMVAKKFLKIIKTLTENKILTPKNIVKKTSTPIKKVVIPYSKKIVTPYKKKVLQK